jgi:hypothetical protein
MRRKKEKGKRKKEIPRSLRVLSRSADYGTENSTKLLALGKEVGQEFGLDNSRGRQQPQPVTRFPRFLQSDIILADEIRSALGSLRFFDVRTDGRSRTQNLRAEGAAYARLFPEAQTEPHDARCERKCSLLDVSRLDRHVGGPCFPFSFFLFPFYFPIVAVTSTTGWRYLMPL